MELIKGEERIKFGIRKSDGATIYISKPKWDCGWYWGFGYLGNENEHYHLSAYQEKDHFFTLEGGSFKSITEKRNICMPDALLADYDLNTNIEKSIWTFCELILTAYALKETAEVLGRGGSYITTNPCAELIKNVEEAKRINKIVLPTIFDSIQKLIEGETYQQY